MKSGRDENLLLGQDIREKGNVRNNGEGKRREEKEKERVQEKLRKSMVEWGKENSATDVQTRPWI